MDNARMPRNQTGRLRQGFMFWDLDGLGNASDDRNARAITFVLRGLEIPVTESLRSISALAATINRDET